MAFVLKVKSLGSKPQNWRKKGLFWAIFRSIFGENMAFFAKSWRKLRTKNFEAHFHRKLRTLEKFSNVKKLRNHFYWFIQKIKSVRLFQFCNKFSFAIPATVFVWAPLARPESVPIIHLITPSDTQSIIANIQLC